MSPRRRRLRKPAFRSPVDDKPEATSSRVRKPVRPGSVQRQKREGRKVKKSKNSPAVPSHGTKLEETKIATTPPHEGTKSEEPKIATTPPHEGAVPLIFGEDNLSDGTLEEQLKIHRVDGGCYIYTPDDILRALEARTKVVEPKISTSPSHEETDSVPSNLSEILKDNFDDTEGSDENCEVTSSLRHTFDFGSLPPKDLWLDIPGLEL